MSIQLIENYQPCDVEEAKVKSDILTICQQEADLFTRDNRQNHFTSSALIISPDKKETLLIHHKIYNAWGWTGGHNDGDEDFKAVALKEAREETGLTNFKFLNNEIASLDILPVKEHLKHGELIAEHQHLNVSYILVADPAERLEWNEEETNDLKWWPLDKLIEVSGEAIMKPVYQKILKVISES